MYPSRLLNQTLTKVVLFLILFLLLGGGSQRLATSMSQGKQNYTTSVTALGKAAKDVFRKAGKSLFRNQ